MRNEYYRLLEVLCSDNAKKIGLPRMLFQSLTRQEVDAGVKPWIEFAKIYNDDSFLPSNFFLSEYYVCKTAQPELHPSEREADMLRKKLTELRAAVNKIKYIPSGTGEDEKNDVVIEALDKLDYVLQGPAFYAWKRWSDPNVSFLDMVSSTMFDAGTADEKFADSSTIAEAMGTDITRDEGKKSSSSVKYVSC
jgi:hypothetical protein